jgi:FKBP-type peptidyl-prolyl cis-trans isomerase
LVYKKLTANEAGAQPTRHGTALVQYTGWRQRTGETFFTTKGRDQPIAQDLSTAAPGFAEALALMHKRRAGNAVDSEEPRHARAAGL